MSVEPHCIDPGAQGMESSSVHVESKHVGPCRTNASATFAARCPLLNQTQWKRELPNSKCDAGWKGTPCRENLSNSLAHGSDCSCWLIRARYSSYTNCSWYLVTSYHQVHANKQKLLLLGLAPRRAISWHVAANPCPNTPYNMLQYLKMSQQFLVLTTPLPLAVGAIKSTTWRKFRRLTDTAFNFSWCQTIHNNTAHPSLYTDPSECERERGFDSIIHV